MSECSAVYGGRPALKGFVAGALNTNHHDRSLWVCINMQYRSAREDSSGSVAELAGVWHTPTFRRLLWTSDVVAYSTTLVMVLLTVARLKEHLPTDQPLTGFHFGPKHPLFNMTTTLLAVWCASAAALLLLAFRPQTYFVYRLPIGLAVRVLRLVLQGATMLTPSSMASLATAVAARVRDNPRKAAVIVVITPMAYYVQHAFILLPWRHVVLIQLASAVIILHWLWHFPCYLQAAQPLLPAPPWQAPLEKACHSLQSYAALLRTAVGGSLSDFSQGVCDGISGMQVLQVFAAWLCLFVGPVVAALAIERWGRLRAVQSRLTDHTRGHSNSQHDQPDRGFSNGGIRGSSSSLLSGSNNSRSAIPQHGSSLQSLLDVTLQYSGHASGWACACLLAVLLLGAVLPVLWLLSELLAEVFEAHRDCEAMLSILTAQ